jgi:hypothetical protein
VDGLGVAVVGCVVGGVVVGVAGVVAVGVTSGPQGTPLRVNAVGFALVPE